MEKIKDKERVNDILLGPLERPALLWLSARMPAWVTPDVLTVIGIIAALIIGAGYYFSNIDRNFLWLVNFGFILNWFGDSLDGNLARYRHIERPKYGYFVDHAVDAFTSTVICIGLGLSPYVGFTYGLLALIGYLLMSIYVYLSSNVTGVFKISYGKIGPTEIRVLYMSVNTVFYFMDNFSVHLGSFSILFFDLIALVVAIILFCYFLVFTMKTVFELAKLDPPGIKKS